VREAAARRRARASLRDEVLRLAVDETDRDGLRIIHEQMVELAPPADP
jgi:hypothetical protein